MTAIDAILARAMAKYASDTSRSDENSQDVKDNVANSVDATNSSDAFGLVDKENTVVLTGQEATTDEKKDGLPKITNDGDAFKEASASQLASVASDILATIVKASADALNVEAAENGGLVENSTDAVGEEEDVSDNGTEPTKAAKAKKKAECEADKKKEEEEMEVTDSAGEEAKEAAELQKELSTFIALREKFAALDEMLNGVDQQAGDDAGNVAEFLSAFQNAPAIDEATGMEGGQGGESQELPPGGPEGAPEEGVAPEAPQDPGLGGGDEQGAIEELIQVLADAGISPEDFTQQVGQLGNEEAKVARTTSAGWKKLSKETRRSLVEDALRKNLRKGA